MRMAKRKQARTGRGGRRVKERVQKVSCPKCGRKVPEDELEAHQKDVHGSFLTVLSEHRRELAILSTLVVIIVVVTLAMSMDDDGEEEGPPPPPPNWQDTYEPVHEVGMLKNDWWTVYPDINPASGSPVDHPTWVGDALDDGPLIILDHSEGCVPCVEQTRDIEAVMEAYQGQITYLDILADGSDQRAYEAFDAYDPNGDPQYIPLTVIVTYVNDGSGKRVVWHSTEGATGKAWIEGYVRDAIYYYQESQEG
jgi:hypothetical protein